MLKWLSIIFVLQLIGSFFNGLFDLPIPASVLGMIMLLLILFFDKQIPKAFELNKKSGNTAEVAYAINALITAIALPIY